MISASEKALCEYELRRRRQVSIENIYLVIGPDTTFLQWCDHLAESGMLVDGHPFRLDNRPAMRWVYSLIPSTIEDAVKQELVLMKCAQVGFTVMEILSMIYMALKFNPAQVGMYLPDMKLASIKSSDRFMPIVRTVPAAYNLILRSSGKSNGEGNVLVRNMGNSRFYFMWTSGSSMTESVPLDIISFDEVQNMTIADMEKTRERMSASRIRYTLMGSTANWPDQDIHFWYKKGTQHQFWTLCPHCGESQILDDYFPECVGYDEELRDYRYVCHFCNNWIDDSQMGEWRALVPDAPYISVHFPQFLSPTITPRDIIEAYYNADDMKNFYNRKRGKPYMDPSQVPINMEMLNDCAALGVKMGVVWKTRAAGTFMGIDQMGAFNVVLVAERLASGHMAVIHAEEIYSQDPFLRCDDIMEIYGVDICVVETLPNYNDAKRFSGRHPGRVFLAGYSDLKEDMLRWGDAVPNGQERKTTDEDRDRYTVTLDQYKCMQVALSRIQKKVCVFPDPMGLVQEIDSKGKKAILPILKDRVFFHLTRTALIAEKDPEQKKYRRRVVKVGIDPHFSYAYMLLNVAWARSHGSGTFILPENPNIKPAGNEVSGLIESVMTPHIGSICGNCKAFVSETSRCSARGFIVRDNDLACFQFLSKD